MTAVPREGQRVIGVAKNEDTFSLQLLGQDENLHLFLKKDLREVLHERRSSDARIFGICAEQRRVTKLIGLSDQFARGIANEYRLRSAQHWRWL